MKIWVLFLAICFVTGFIPNTMTPKRQRWLTIGMICSLCIGYFAFHLI